MAVVAAEEAAVVEAVAEAVAAVEAAEEEAEAAANNKPVNVFLLRQPNSKPIKFTEEKFSLCSFSCTSYYKS